MGRGPREVGDLDLPSLAGMGGVILSVALLWGCSPDRRLPFAGWGLGRNSGWDCGQVLGTWYCPCDSFPGAGTQAGGSAPAPAHAEGGQAGGREGTQAPLPAPPPQTAEGASSGRAVPCAVTAGVAPTATLSVASVAAWMATQGPNANRVSQAPGESGLGHCPLSPTLGPGPTPPHAQS